MIRSVGHGKYKLFSKKTGKPLSKATSKAGALKRERQVEYFKHHSDTHKAMGKKHPHVPSKM